MSKKDIFLTKAEKREEKTRKRRGHKVSGKKVIALARLIDKKSHDRI